MKSTVTRSIVVLLLGGNLSADVARTVRQHEKKRSRPLAKEAYSMQIMRIFDRDDWKASRKIEALKKILEKLEKENSKIEKDLKSEDSRKKSKKLEIKLKTNKRHHQKAMKLINELQQAAESLILIEI